MEIGFSLRGFRSDGVLIEWIFPVGVWRGGGDWWFVGVRRQWRGFGFLPWVTLCVCVWFFFFFFFGVDGKLWIAGGGGGGVNVCSAAVVVIVVLEQKEREK